MSVLNWIFLVVAVVAVAGGVGMAAVIAFALRGL